MLDRVSNTTSWPASATDRVRVATFHSQVANQETTRPRTRLPARKAPSRPPPNWARAAAGDQAPTAARTGRAAAVRASVAAPTAADQVGPLTCGWRFMYRAFLTPYQVHRARAARAQAMPSAR